MIALVLSLTALAAEPCEGTFDLTWQRAGQVYPATFHGELTLERSRKRHLANISWVESAATFDQVDVHCSQGTLFLRNRDPEGFELQAFHDGDRWLGHARWASLPWSPIEARRWVPGRIDAKSVAPWPTATPEEVGLQADAVDAFIREAAKRDSHGLVVIKDGKLVVDRAFAPGAGPLMSITKPLSSLAVPFLMKEGLWDSLDAPLSKAFTDWEGDPRGDITLRQLLSHRSGLHHNASAQELNRQPDRVTYVLGTELETPPGESFSYNNRAFALLGGLVQRTADTDIQSYLTPRLFEPLDITAHWSTDTAGTPDTYGGAAMTTVDLAKLGQLMVDDGLWQGERVLPEGWMAEASTPQDGTLAGLGWFVLEAGAPTSGFWHSGWLGQWLVVLPELDMVIARQHRGFPESLTDIDDHSWKSFVGDALGLVPDQN